VSIRSSLISVCPQSTTGSRGELEDATIQGHSPLSRYRKHGGKRDLEFSIAEFERALSVCPSDHPYLAAAQSNFPMVKFILCQVEEARAEALPHEAMELGSTESHEKRAATFVLELHARRRVNPVWADDKSAMTQDSTSRLTDEDPWFLSVQLLERFERFGDVADLQQAITLLEELVRSTSVWDDQHRGGLGNLGVALSYRFERLGELRDLEDAISSHRDAVNLTPHGHPDKPGCLGNLGNSLVARFERLGELSDIDDAISSHRDAVDLTPHGHPNRPGHLNRLGSSFRVRFERLGELSDLEEAISTLRDAVDLTPHGHPDKPGHLNNLGNSVFTRFECLGELSDHEDAISTLRDAVDLTPYGHPDKPGRLNNLGSSFFTRFQRLGELSDLEDAISTYMDAVDLTPHGHPDKPSRLNNLGNSFTRFQRLGEPSDLDDAISMLRDAVDLTPHGHPGKPGHLNNFGNFFLARLEPLGELSDVEDAISTLRDAVDFTPHGHPDKPGHLNNLGNSCKVRSQHLGELSDLDDAISTLRDAVDLTPHGHPNKPGHLSNLGNSFFTRFQRLGKLNDLDDAISTLRDAVDLTPHGHPHKLTLLTNLGNSFKARFDCIGELSNLEQAISLYLRAASASIGPISVRFDASQKWISCAQHLRHHSLLHAYSIAISLLPELAWIGLSLTQRYYELRRGANVVREAAAAALDLGLPETAVESLEQGRSIVWGELFQLRSSYEELSSAHPDHAHRLRELSAALEHASATREKSLSALLERPQSAVHPTTESLRQEANAHRMLAIERDKLLQAIRRLPGFERFLLHKDFSQLRASAHSGPVVILNAAESRCDALIVLADVDHVIHVPLPTFTFRRSAGLQKMLEKLLGHARVICCDDRDGEPATRGCVSWEPLLSNLWIGVVKPVLDALAFSVRHSIVSLKFIPDPFMCLLTDSWGPITHFLVSDWPFRVSSSPRSWFLRHPAFTTRSHSIRLCHLVIRPYSQHSCPVTQFRCVA
jgi:tetratricopeptide (TPR) repeat protein